MTGCLDHSSPAQQVNSSRPIGSVQTVLSDARAALPTAIGEICCIVLAHNETLHLERCLSSLRQVAARIVVVDSGSTDNTPDIARRHGADVYFNPWVNYATQFNWALDNAHIAQAWCLRIDADEYLSETLQSSIRQQLLSGTPPDKVTGLSMNRIMVFMGRPIRWGGVGGLYMLRLFRTGQGRCEQRWMDEHIELSGGITYRLTGELIDHNLNNIGWWINKHNGYATREAIDLLNIRHRFEPRTPQRTIGAGSQAAHKRWLKERVYANLPAGLRAVMYFLWRYLFKLGFLDGRPGLAFHFLQGFWYRLLVDLKTQELEQRARAGGCQITDIIDQEYGYKVGARPPES